MIINIVTINPIHPICNKYFLKLMDIILTIPNLKEYDFLPFERDGLHLSSNGTISYGKIDVKVFALLYPAGCRLQVPK